MLKPIGLFATPDCVKDLQDYVSKFKGPDAILANTIMGMAWNLCAKLTKNAVKSGVAQMAMYLDKGLEHKVGKKSAEFNEWLCGAGDLERTIEILELCEELERVMPEEIEFPWSTLCYVVLEDELAEFIYAAFAAKKDFQKTKVINRFEQLLVEYSDQ